MRKYLLIITLTIISFFLTACFSNSNEEDKNIYKIKYIVNNEEVDLSPNLYSVSFGTNLPTYLKPDYSFINWYLTEDFSGEPYTKIEPNTKGDITLYAKLLKEYNLTLNFNGAYIVDYQETFHEEENVNLPLNIFKDGYKFIGWYKNEDFSGDAYTSISEGTKENLTFFAKFLKEHKLTLNFSGGEEVEYINTFTEEETLSLPENITKDNYMFVGWYLNSDFSGQSIKEIPLGTNSDITLYAKFVKTTSTLTLEFNGGDSVSYNEVINYDVEYYLPTNINKENYEFIGWYLNPYFPEERIYKIDKYTDTDVTLYAHYQISDFLFNYVTRPLDGTVISNNLVLDPYILDDLFWVTLESEDEDIISNDGILKRPYEEREITLTFTITDYETEIKKDYTYLVAGYKSLDAPIRSGYIYREYYKVNDYYFENQEILYTAFSLADGNGNFTDTANLGYFGNVNFNIMPKAKELGVRVIMSVGPSSSWRTFAKTHETRLNFANNVVELINQHGFDGVDIDWETPRAGYGEDVYFVELMKLVHQKVKENNPNHLVTAAITGGSSQGPNYDLPKSGQYLDYVNLMTYHMAADSGFYQSALYPRTTLHNPALNVGRTPGNATISGTITVFTNSFKMPREKLIVGVPFYGIKQVRSYNDVTNTYSNWSQMGSLAYKDVLFEISKEDFTVVFDEVAKVPYLINDAGTIFVSYENPQSISLKGEYVIEQGLAGMMYWEYFHEHENTLLQAMVESLPKT